jgi:hypothetical protein
MSPLLPFIGMFAVYLGTAKLVSPIASTGGNQNAVPDSSRQAGARLCAA